MEPRSSSFPSLCCRTLAAMLALGFGLDVHAADMFQEKIDRLLKEHALIRMVDADVLTAQEQIAVESSAYFPRLTVQGSSGRERIDRDTGTSGNFRPNEVSAQITQLVSDFGATSARVDAARAVAEKEDFERKLQTQNLLLAAVEAQLKLIRANRAFSFAKESEANIKRQTQLEDARVEAGKGYATDVLQAKGQLAGAEARRVRAELQLAEAMNRYKAVFGTSTDPNSLQGLQLPESFMPEGEEHLDEIVGQNNPDTLAAMARQRVANAERRAQINRELMPRVDVLVSRSTGDDIDGATGTRDDSKAMLRFNWSFDTGMRASHISSATLAAVKSATAKTDYVRTQASEESRSAWANWRMSKQRAGYLDNQVKISANFLDLARRERELGRRSLLDILNGETALINARSDALEARIDEIIAAFRVMRATGLLESDLFRQSGVIANAADWSPIPQERPDLQITASGTSDLSNATSPSSQSTQPDSEQVGNFLSHWQKSWASADIEAYLACYADSFQPANGLSRGKWIAQRRERISKAGVINLEVSDMRITKADDRFSVEFLQRYQAENHADEVRKHMILEKDEEGRLVIAREAQILASVSKP